MSILPIHPSTTPRQASGTPRQALSGPDGRARAHAAKKRIAELPVAPPKAQTGPIPAPAPAGKVKTGKLPLGAPPLTTWQRPWDRIAISATPHKETWRPVLMSLREQLPASAPPPQRIAGTVLIYAIEILLGRRPLAHLRNWLDPDVFATLGRRYSLAMRIEGKAPASRAPRIRRLQISSPLPRVAEVIAVLPDGTNVRGAALRLEFQGTRWKVIALELG